MNPELRARRENKRRRLLNATRDEPDRIVSATRRDLRPLHGKDKIGVRVGRVSGQYKVAKHFKITITGQPFEYSIDQPSIDAQARIDGIYIVRTSLPNEILKAPDVVLAYKSLPQVKRAFQCMKTTDLNLPIYHRLDDRVCAHVFLCMLSYYVARHMRKALAPLAYTEEAADKPEHPLSRKGPQISTVQTKSFDRTKPMRD